MSWVVKFIGHDGIERQTQPLSCELAAKIAQIAIPICFESWIEEIMVRKECKEGK